MFNTYKLVSSHHVPGIQGPTKMSSCWKRQKVILNSGISWVLLKMELFLLTNIYDKANKHFTVWYRFLFVQHDVVVVLNSHHR